MYLLILPKYIFQFIYAYYRNIFLNLVIYMTEIIFLSIFIDITEIYFLFLYIINIRFKYHYFYNLNLSKHAVIILVIHKFKNVCLRNIYL